MGWKGEKENKGCNEGQISKSINKGTDRKRSCGNKENSDWAMGKLTQSGGKRET